MKNQVFKYRARIFLRSVTIILSSSTYDVKKLKPMSIQK